MFHPKIAQQSPSSGLTFRSATSGQYQGYHHILKSRKCREEIKGLKNEANFFTPKVAQNSVRSGRNILTIKA
jgi:hypothetical protein